jgi:hypothetical protein
MLKVEFSMPSGLPTGAEQYGALTVSDYGLQMQSRKAQAVSVSWTSKFTLSL